jgi:outer membrane protein TolC
LLTFFYNPFCYGQTLLTLDSCRAMALRNNKQMRMAEVRRSVAADVRRSARTKYLPHVSAVGAYEHTSREISLLSDAQKSALGSLGTTVAIGLQGSLATYAQMLPAAMQQQLGTDLGQAATALNGAGEHLVDALRTDTRNLWAGSILLTQPLYMGGAIVATNRMADLSEEMAANAEEAQRQATLYSVDQAYWQVVSLEHKQRLAESYLQLVKKLDADVTKMTSEGVATRSDALSVSVKVNEAEMALTKVNDGLSLSKMLLCQICGLPVTEQIDVADESMDDREYTYNNMTVPTISFELRPELKLLQNTVDISRQATRLMRATGLPQVMLTGGYAVTNPNTFNGFERKFGGFWNVGLLVRIPVWNWGDVRYKVRASKGLTAIRQLELDETREKIELQVNQCTYRTEEAQKRLRLAQSSIERAEENLRTANLGFAEGVITPTTVMEAQTAWLQAQSERVDAEIEVRMAQTDLEKSLGTLGNNQ